MELKVVDRVSDYFCLDKTGALEACPLQFVGSPHPMQNARRNGANINASTNFAKHFRLFVNLNVKSCTQQQSCCRQATDAPAQIAIEV